MPIPNNNYLHKTVEYMLRKYGHKATIYPFAKDNEEYNPVTGEWEEDTEEVEGEDCYIYFKRIKQSDIATFTIEKEDRIAYLMYDSSPEIGGYIDEYRIIDKKQIENKGCSILYIVQLR